MKPIPTFHRLHPHQEMIVDEDGTVRFRQNAIVRMLLDTGKFNLNDIAMMNFSLEDRIQFAQLIGYSVNGFGELSSYVPLPLAQEMDDKAEEVYRKWKKAKRALRLTNL